MIRHPNICKMFGYFEEKGKLYYILEFIEGKELYQLVYEDDHSYEFTKYDILHIVYQLIHILAYLSNCKVIHRDIKLENIIINTKTLNIKLVDFGWTVHNKKQIERQTYCGTELCMN